MNLFSQLRQYNILLLNVRTKGIPKVAQKIKTKGGSFSKFLCTLIKFRIIRFVCYPCHLEHTINVKIRMA